jgi:hypothetical protein
MHSILYLNPDVSSKLMHSILYLNPDVSSKLMHPDVSSKLDPQHSVFES